MKARLFGLFAVAAVLGCSAESTTDPLAPMGLELALTPAQDTIFITDTLKGNETLQLSVSASTPQVGTVPTPPGRVFESATPDVAVVDPKTGLVRAVAIGTADITVRVNDVKAHATIVVAHPANRVLVTPRAVDILQDNAFTVADTARLSATAYDANGDALQGVAYAFSSSDTSVITVDATGKVRALKVGTAIISASAEGMTGTATVHALRSTRSLAVAVPTDTIFVDDPIDAGDTTTVTPVAKDSLGVQRSGVEYTFASNNPAVAVVSATGIVTAKGLGTATISVTGADLTVPMTVHVLPVARTVTLSAPSANVLVGDTVQLVAEARGWAGELLSDRAFTYVSNATRATVSGSGRATFTAPGTATFTATTAYTSGSVTLTAYQREFIGGTLGSLSSGMDASCGLLPLGRVYCFGRGPLLGVAKDTVCFDDDQTATSPCSLVPLRATIDLPMQSVSVGDSVACGVTTDQHVYCWGDQTYGQLGNGISSPGSAVSPVLVRGPLQQAATFTQVAVGRAHACALDPDGIAYCWGADSAFQLGGADGRHVVNSSTPTLIGSSLKFKSIVAGRSHTCALLALDGTAYCWGSNAKGQLGRGTFGDNSDVPTAVPGPKYVQLTAGAQHTCGLTQDGTIYCWGYNRMGQAASSTDSVITTPTAVSGSGYFVVSAGWDHTCAIASGGTAYCWGANAYGQLGGGTSGTPALSRTPVAVVGSHVFSTISAGRRTSCAVASDGAYCWGSSIMGALGSQIQAVGVGTPRKTATPE